MVGAPPVRRRAKVAGVVQGVGFRPFVYNLARELNLSGFVTNTAAGVELAVEGQAPAVEDFLRRLVDDAPPLARITAVEAEAEPPQGDVGFIIRASRAGTRRTLISPDAAVCAACLAEMRDPSDRRHGYAFINCTHCGPRYTIIQDLPYDRPQTTMAVFKMCPACQAEYDDPADRRFHAQPNACPVCGPRLWLADADGVEVAADDPVAALAQRLRAGEVAAIKGLGGFHLACDPFNAKAVARLRGRKHREEKPLALMVPDLAAAKDLVELDAAGEDALTSRERPIVLAPQRPGTGVAAGVNPRNRLLGVMLPYTPLHHLIMDQGFRALVMTSGNVSEEPICLDNAEAVCRIGAPAARGAIADLFLLHNRDIYLRSDDSVVRPVAGRVRPVRRSRGYVPAPIALDAAVVPKNAPPVLAAGAHLKNTVCLLRGREAFVSQHLGDLANAEALDFFRLTAGHLERIMEARAGVLACDLHPDYLSTGWAQERARREDLPLVRVQHHHAHAVAVMAEHGLSGPALGLSLDGTGYGPDGTVWGGELLLARRHGYRRLGRVSPFHLPGGEAAVREPWRVALGMLTDIYGPDAAQLDLPVVRAQGRHLELIARMKARGLNTPLTSSLGRLFDAAAALAGLRWAVAYEGQAAIELEQAIDPGAGGAGAGYPFRVAQRGGLIELAWYDALTALVEDALAGISPGVMAARFHAGLVHGLAAWAQAGAEAAGMDQVVLGGGCLLNAEIITGLPPLLEAAGLKPHLPRELPAGDGGLSLGQAVAAAAAWARGLPEGETVLGEDDDHS